MEFKDGSERENKQMTDMKWGAIVHTKQKHH